MITPNGSYIVQTSPTQANALNIVIASMNSDDMQTNCAFGGRQPSCYLSYFNQYCGNNVVGTGLDTYTDPRCVCFDSKLIIDSIFDITVLQQNPVLYEQLLAIALCITSTCTTYKTENNVVGHYLNETIECPNSINICTNVLKLGNDSSINGDVVIASNCGSGSTFECASGCPLGLYYYVMMSIML